MAPVEQIAGPFLAPNRAEICQSVGFCQFSTGITWNMIY